MRAEVRCCCDPCKLLGTVEVSGDLERKRVVNFALRSDSLLGETITLEMDKWEIYNGFLDTRRSGLAFKSMNTPIGTLRRITTWKDA